MDEHKERSRAAAAQDVTQDADATQFVTVDHIPNDRPDPRRVRLLAAVALGAVLGLALLAAVVYTHREHPAPARAGTRP